MCNEVINTIEKEKLNTTWILKKGRWKKQLLTHVIKTFLQLPRHSPQSARPEGPEMMRIQQRTVRKAKITGNAR